MMTPDRLLGRSFTFFNGTDTRFLTIKHLVQVIAYDPERGWKLAGAGFAPAWVPSALWRQLLKHGILVQS